MKILIIDIETTGFLQQSGKIVEVGIVELDLSNGNRKIIFDTERTKKSENKKAHDRPLRVWISKEFKQKQQSNRRLKHQTFNLFNL